MPIPVDRPGNVDVWGGTPYSQMRPGEVACTGRLVRSRLRSGLRVWVESVRLQPERSLRRAWATRLVVVDEQGHIIFAAPLGFADSLAELTNDADDNGTDDA